MGPCRHRGNGQPVDHPAAREARAGNATRDERRAIHRERGRAAIGRDDAGGLTEHHEPGRRRQEEDEPQSPEHGPVALSSAGAVARVAASSVTPERAVSHALVAPVMASTAASPASVTRTPANRMDQPKVGAAIMAPAGSRLTR